MHLQSCKNKWESEQRKPLPQPPNELEDLDLSEEYTSEALMKAYNEAAFDTYKTEVAEPCSKCSSLFHPSNLAKHHRNCKVSAEPATEYGQR